MRLNFSSASCPNCDTLFERVPVEYDEDGGYAFLEVHPCADPVCGKFLCACCDQFHCDGCGETFCADHLVSVPDGTERPLHFCPQCAEETEEMGCPTGVCPERYALVMACEFAYEMARAIRAHETICRACNPALPAPILPQPEKRLTLSAGAA